MLRVGFRVSARQVESAPRRNGHVGIGMIAGRPAGALDQAAAAGGGGALVVDVARAVTGGTVRQPFRVADVFLGHGFLHSSI